MVSSYISLWSRLRRCFDAWSSSSPTSSSTGRSTDDRSPNSTSIVLDDHISDRSVGSVFFRRAARKGIGLDR